MITQGKSSLHTGEYGFIIWAAVGKIFYQI
jgi:hypothetical protein